MKKLLKFLADGHVSMAVFSFLLVVYIGLTDPPTTQSVLEQPEGKEVLELVGGDPVIAQHLIDTREFSSAKNYEVAFQIEHIWMILRFVFIVSCMVLCWRIIVLFNELDQWSVDVNLSIFRETFFEETVVKCEYKNRYMQWWIEIRPPPPRPAST